MRVLQVENVISNIRFPSLNESMNRLDAKVETLSKKKSDKFKITLSRVVTIGSMVLFIAAYNLTPNVQIDNETPVGLASR